MYIFFFSVKFGIKIGSGILAFICLIPSVTLAYCIIRKKCQKRNFNSYKLHDLTYADCEEAL